MLTTDGHSNQSSPRMRDAQTVQNAHVGFVYSVVEVQSHFSAIAASCT
jgi:hypothetical protein